ncbi:ATPase morc-1 [Caenorhabditis elegans]|uniref:ATPase morc-1 n=1 Tax=Caenorhabditis elegans TaxID=6239 RepID=MORC1_CAEEL|nr:ATPase morc-1 [Caenorhabditis elegans]Q23243.2 RecName: Full=ATPase morc-1 [Caenorhabditis elegans]CCD66674.1 ATPase morc-1 [Caenorhabditis elegans]|eukprot:NP_498104.1 Protein morc-1 [Caenorhabditis elegans]
MPNDTNGDDYKKLEKASVNLNFLKSNSHTHIGPLSAIAELVDNAYDADARDLHIDFLDINNEQFLELRDDGLGMAREEALHAITFGHSAKCSYKIGRYGNGLKSGAFHLGRELLLVTKKDGIITALLISHRFHEDQGLTNSVFVPCPSFDLDGIPICQTESEKDRFNLEMKIIGKYAPLGSRTLAELADKITGSTGTIIIIGNLRRSVTGELAINTTKDPTDIIVDSGEENKPWRESLRKYLEFIYLKPRMRIHVRGEQVLPKRISENWIAKKQQLISGDQFTAAYNKILDEKNETVKKCEEEKALVMSEIGGTNYTSVRREDRANQKSLRLRVDTSQKNLDSAIADRDAFKKEGKSEKSFHLNMGIETKDRSNNGIHFYINNRLILWGNKEAKFFSKFANSIGISMFLSLDYSLFSAAQNKQGFDHVKDFQVLVRKCNDALRDYSMYLEKSWIPTHLKNTWNVRIYEGDDVWAVLWGVYGYNNTTSTTCVQTHDSARDQVMWTTCGIWKLCQMCRTWIKASRPNEIVGSNDDFFCCENVNHHGCRTIVAEDNDFSKLPEKYDHILPQKRLTNSAPSSSDSQNSIRSASSCSSSSRLLNVAKIESHERIHSSTGGHRLGESFSTTSVKMEPIPNNAHDSHIAEVQRRHSTGRAISPAVSEISRRAGTAPSSQLDMIMGEESDESQEALTIRAPRQRAKRPIERVSRRNRRDQSDDDSDSENEERYATAPKKSKVKGKAVVRAPKMTREKWLEEMLNQFLTAHGEQPLPKNGQRDFDPTNIVEQTSRRNFKNNQRIVDAQQAIMRQIGSVLDHLKRNPTHNFKIPASGTVEEKLKNIEHQIKGKKK